MKIDLHCHTKMSDGSAGVSEVIALAKLQGVDVLAVTDHDTLAGSVRAAEIGRREGIEVIPGTEISAFDYSRGRRVHVLCYYPEKTGRFERLLRHITESRREAMKVSIQKVLRLYPIPEEMILARSRESTNFYKQHVMQALLDAGYADGLFGDVFRRLFHPKEGLAYTKVEYPDVMDVIDIIHNAGGAAVLAHPSEYRSMELMQELCEKDMIEGVEAFHPRNTPEDTEAIVDSCARFHKAATGGTDFHGYYTTARYPIGSYLTPEGQFVIVKGRHERLQR